MKLNHNVLNKSEDEKGCPFCNPAQGRELIVESETAYAVYDRYPVNEGHALIIPKRHCANYFELTLEEQIACMTMINEVRNIVKKTIQSGWFKYRNQYWASGRANGISCPDPPYTTFQGRCG